MSKPVVLSTGSTNTSAGTAAKVVLSKDMFVDEDAIAKTLNPIQMRADFNSEANKFKSALATCLASRNDQNIRNARAATISCLVAMKRLNRLSNYRKQIVRDRVSDCRKQLEDRYLQLQNLLYEAAHVKKEVTRCLEFKSSHEDIELVPMEEFKSLAPASLQDVPATASQHQMRLNRLSFELQQRTDLQSKIGEHQTELAELHNSVDSTEQQLADLHPQLDKIISAAAAVQPAMGFDYIEEAAQLELAGKLPNPLFYLYTYTKVMLTVDKNCGMSLTVLGSLAELDSYNRRIKLAEHVESDDSGHEGCDQPEQDEGSARKRRERDSKGSRKQPSVSAPLVTDVFPLSVCIKAHGMSTTFSYFPHVKLVCVSGDLLDSSSYPALSSADNIVSADDILRYLSPEDTPDAYLKLPSFAELSSSSSLSDLIGYGFPYVWAQELCGLASLPEPSSGLAKGELRITDECREAHSALTKFLTGLTERISSRKALYRELKSLEARNFEFPFRNCAEVKLTNFEGQVWNDVEQDVSDRPHFSDVVESPKEWWIFKASMDLANKVSGCTANGRAIIAISRQHPSVVPRVALCNVGSADSAAGPDMDQRDATASKVSADVQSAERHILQSSIDKKESLVELLKSVAFCLCVLTGTSGAAMPRGRRGRERALPFGYDEKMQSHCFV